MIYREYGTTGKEVSAIGFGGMRFEDQNNAEKCAELIISAYDMGINYFDTAPGYEKSEDLFGVAFKEMLKHRDQKPFYVATKSMRGTATEVRRDTEKSLERMGIDRIDFHHVWCICDMDDYRERKAQGVLREFEKMKEEGLIEHIVVSTHLPGREIRDLLNDYPYEGVLLGYSAMNFAYRQEGVRAALERGIGVVAMNPLGGGIIPQNPELFDFLRTDPRETVVEAAIRFLLNTEGIDVALVGIADQTQLEQAIAAADGLREIDKEKLKHIESSLRESFEELCTNCGYCDHCPVGIPVPQIMDSYNHYRLRNEPKAVLNRLRYHWGIDDVAAVIERCTECGLCEEKCTQSLPILARFQDVLKIDS